MFSLSTNEKAQHWEDLKQFLHCSYLDGPFQLRLLVTQPHHAYDGQGHTQPVEEAEEVDD